MKVFALTTLIVASQFYVSGDQNFW